MELSRVLLVLVCCVSALGEIPPEAQQIILDQAEYLGFGEIDKTIPLYRITDNIISHYFVQSRDDYMITKAGDHIEGPKLVLQGEKNSPITNLDKQAKKYKTTCATYYIMSPEGALACKNADGKFVAADLGPKENTTSLLKENNATDVDQLLKSKQSVLSDRWAVRKNDSEPEAKGLDDSKKDDSSSLDLSKAFKKRPEAKSISNIIINPISPSVPVYVSVGEKNGVIKIEINYMQQVHETDAENAKAQEKLCKAVTNCQNNAISLEHIEYQADLTYVEILLVDDAMTILGDRSTVFAVDVTRTGKPSIAKYYEVVNKPDRSKRQWSAYTEYWIPVEYEMPNYNQFSYDGCSVGCGPVAWAQIFGYLDRRAHYHGYSWGSKYLYRDGWNGMVGSEYAIAPYGLYDSRIYNYIIEIRKKLGSFCAFSYGATPMWAMDDIWSFFRDNQLQGGRYMEWKTHWLTYLGVYSSSIESWTRARVGEGWPVIIGKWHGWAWHYPVVTGYRWRSYRYRDCGWFSCSWEYEYEYTWYLRYGWGGSNNGWYYTNAFYAIFAKYY